MDNTSCNSASTLDFNKIEQNVLGEMKHILKSLMETLKFNIIYSKNVSEEQEQTTAKAVKEYRNKFWNEALKKANGNRDKAYKLYTENLSLLN